jgi:hypothetical protein
VIVVNLLLLLPVYLVPQAPQPQSRMTPPKKRTEESRVAAPIEVTHLLAPTVELASD